MTLILLVRKTPAAIFIGMIITAVVGIFLGVVELPTQIIAPIPSLNQRLEHYLKHYHQFLQRK